MLHRSCDRALIKDNHSFNNAEAGLALHESSDCKVKSNTFENNKRELWLRRFVNAVGTQVRSGELSHVHHRG